MKTTMKNVFFDANETKDLSVNFSNVEYPFGDIKVFVWEFDFEKMIPMALGICSKIREILPFCIDMYRLE